MSKIKVLIIGGMVAFTAIGGYVLSEKNLTFSEPEVLSDSYTTHEVGFDDTPDHIVPMPDYPFGSGGWYTLNELRTYVKPVRERPLVGLQIGHWQHREAPDELAGLRGNTGAIFGSYTELELMLEVGERVATLLRNAGIDVDILPVTIPPGYEADAFITLHADGNTNTSVRGFKIAGPRIDYSGYATALVDALRIAYRASTELPEDPQITRRMSSYYAFNWARYEHAVHPYTPSAIVETGFVSNVADRTFLIAETDRVANGIATGIQAFLALERPVIIPRERLEAPQLPLFGTVTCAPLRAERVGTREPGCEASLKTEAGNYYLLMSEPPIATSSLPYQATLQGVYYPAQTIPTYFWFPYEIRGILKDAIITPQT